MRIELQLSTQNGSILPYNYEYALSAWIYKMLDKADPVFAEWLHQQGYSLTDSHKRYKLFTYSKIRPRGYFRDKRGIGLETGKATLQLSFLVDEAMQNFVMGVFQNQTLDIITRNGRVSFAIEGVNVLPNPQFKPIMKFRATKPIFMSIGAASNKHAQYISPQHPQYSELFINNLIDKAETLGLEPTTSLTHFQCLSEPVSRMLRVKSTNIRAFNFDFLVTAPPELIRVGYFAGFGGKNSSLGLGFCEIMTETRFTE